MFISTTRGVLVNLAHARTIDCLASPRAEGEESGTARKFIFLNFGDRVMKLLPDEGQNADALLGEIREGLRGGTPLLPVAAMLA